MDIVVNSMNEIPKHSTLKMSNAFCNQNIAVLKIVTNKSNKQSTESIRCIVPYYENVTNKAYVSNIDVDKPDKSMFDIILHTPVKGYTLYGSGTNETINIKVPGDNKQHVMYVVGMLYQHDVNGGTYDACEIQYLSKGIREELKFTNI
ncbi:MAG: hypothetical protein J6D03_07845 [Clostridia bacterium]|nr:hypothetical protein [Clostridia bacterium]